ncbi:MAG TPA: thiazole biosynthesis protein, partial [Planctomycetaceae bacterium]|nr:thiazole biosynthesis protein [Planctomycetaceae bacterium]
GMLMNECVLQPEAREVLEDAEVRIKERPDGLLVTDAVELAASLCVKALQAGAKLLNALTVEDVCVRESAMTGLVVNQTTVLGTLHVDPIVFRAAVTIDATGHEAAVVHALLKHGHKIQSPTGDIVGEGAMHAERGEKFVVEKTSEIFPGLLLAGMSVCAVYGGPRMGPIFGGMLLSGRKAAGIAIAKCKVRS